jgi:cytidylate kinase
MRIITISRQFGSGGRTIGKQLANKLGIPCYDAELITRIAQESGFAEEYVAEMSEDAAGKSWFANAISSRDYNGHSFQDDLWIIQRKVILELAKKRVLCHRRPLSRLYFTGTADCLRVFIYADMESRAKRIVEQYGESNKSPEKRLKEKDKRRAAYYQYYTDTKWGDVRNYHIALDSAALGMETCVELLAQLYDQKRH